MHTTNYSTAQNIFTFGKMTIDGVITNSSGGKVTLYAEKGFTLSPGAHIVGPNIELKIGLTPDFCDAGPIAPTGELSTYCNSSEYKANRKSEAFPDVVNNKNKPVYEYFDAYPNPARNILNLHFSINNSKPDYKIKISDLEGRTIKTINSTGNPGFNSIKLDISGFSEGIYFITYQTANFQTVKKIIIINQY